MSSGMDEVFGPMPGRPDHPDFWRLSESVLMLDGRLEAADDKSAVFREMVSEIVDVESLHYMALQRSFRALDVTTIDQVIDKAVEVTLLVASYMDGFMTGCTYELHEGSR